MKDIPYGSLLKPFSDKPFAKRILQPQDYPILRDEQTGQMATHLMRASPDEEGNWWVYPSLTLQDGEWQYEKDEELGLKNALKQNNAIPFGDHKEYAVWFSRNYKPKAFNEYMRQIRKK